MEQSNPSSAKPSDPASGSIRFDAIVDLSWEHNAKRAMLAQRSLTALEASAGPTRDKLVQEVMGRVMSFLSGEMLHWNSTRMLEQVKITFEGVRTDLRICPIQSGWVFIKWCRDMARQAEFFEKHYDSILSHAGAGGKADALTRCRTAIYLSMDKKLQTGLFVSVSRYYELIYPAAMASAKAMIATEVRARHAEKKAVAAAKPSALTRVPVDKEQRDAFFALVDKQLEGCLDRHFLPMGSRCAARLIGNFPMIEESRAAYEARTDQYARTLLFNNCVRDDLVPEVLVRRSLDPMGECERDCLAFARNVSRDWFEKRTRWGREWIARHGDFPRPVRVRSTQVDSDADLDEDSATVAEASRKRKTFEPYQVVESPKFPVSIFSNAEFSFEKRFCNGEEEDVKVESGNKTLDAHVTAIRATVLWCETPEMPSVDEMLESLVFDLELREGACTLRQVYADRVKVSMKPVLRFRFRGEIYEVLSRDRALFVLDRRKIEVGGGRVSPSGEYHFSILLDGKHYGVSKELPLIVKLPGVTIANHGIERVCARGREYYDCMFMICADGIAYAPQRVISLSEKFREGLAHVTGYPVGLYGKDMVRMLIPWGPWPVTAPLEWLLTKLRIKCVFNDRGNYHSYNGSVWTPNVRDEFRMQGMELLISFNAHYKRYWKCVVGHVRGDRHSGRPMVGEVSLPGFDWWREGFVEVTESGEFKTWIRA